MRKIASLPVPLRLARAVVGEQKHRDKARDKSVRYQEFKRRYPSKSLLQQYLEKSAAQILLRKLASK